MVSAAKIFAASAASTGSKASGRHVLAIQDTTALSFPQRRSSPNGLGPGGDGKVPGLFLHPVLCIDAETDQCLGIAAGRVWTRAQGKVADRKGRLIADKESVRWLEEGEAAKQALCEAAHVTLIGDRESDIFEHWAGLPDEDFDLLTRARHNRKLADGEWLFDAPGKWCEADRTKIAIKATKGRKGRIATLVLRVGCVEICKPNHGVGDDLPDSVKLRMVDVCEVDAPDGIEPVHWRLLTTHEVKTAAEGWRIVRYYQQRWRIEEYFRILKRSGMDLEGALVESLDVLVNLVAMACIAGVPVMQLLEGREASAEHRAEEVIETQSLDFAIALCRKMEGKTEKQKNPHEERSLAWLAWIVGRLGGWDGYYGKAGPKTMAHGWETFQAMHKGWKLMRDV